MKTYQTALLGSAMALALDACSSTAMHKDSSGTSMSSGTTTSSSTTATDSSTGTMANGEMDRRGTTTPTTTTPTNSTTTNSTDSTQH
jgi:hypothetical protein